MENKETEIRAVFNRFPGLKHVFVNDAGVYLTRREGAKRVSLEDIKKPKKASKKNTNK